jgi:hypothetical protein
VATVVTINRPDVVAHIEAVAQRLTGGNKTEAVALALRTLDQHAERRGSLFGVHRGSVRIQKGFDLVAPVLQDEMDAETGILG